MATVKRVISHPEEVGRNHTKLSKQSSNTNIGNKEDILTPAMGSLTIVSGVENESSECPDAKSLTTRKVTNATHVIASDNDEEDIATSSNELAVEDTTTSDNQAQSSSTDEANKIKEEKEENSKSSEFVRQVSVDTSNAQKNTAVPPRVIEVPTASGSSTSVIRNKSESTVSSAAGTSTAAKDWGWFEDIHDHSSKGQKSPEDGKKGKKGDRKKGGLLLFDDLVNPLNEIIAKKKSGDEDGTMMAVTAPTYVLEESKSSQQLWKTTAGTRPPQPVDERAFYEKIWAQNFQRSQVDYKIPTDVLTATSPVSLSPFADPNDYTSSERPGDDITSEVDEVSAIQSKNERNAGFYASSTRRTSKHRKEEMMEPHNHHHTLVNKKVKDDGNPDDELTVLVRGDNVFGTTVSKSFTTDDKLAIDTVSISIASYRVVESKKHGKYAQFLVIFCEGTFRDTVGVWKRYSDFEQLSRRVTYGQENCTSVFATMNPLDVTEESHEMLPNAITSWNLLKKRKRWYRCLDAGYLSLKAFLLERFLHDILFESTTAQILREFVGFKMN